MRFGFATPFAATSETIDYALLHEIKAADYDYWEPPGDQLSRLTDEEFIRLETFIRELKLDVFGCCAAFPPTLQVFTSSFAAFTDYLHGLLARLRRLGCPAIGFGSPKSRFKPAGMTDAQAQLYFQRMLEQVFLPLLDRYDLILLIEPLRPDSCNFLNSLDEGWETVRLAGSPRIGLLADTLHMAASGDTPEILMRHLDHVSHIHVSEADRVLPEHGYSDHCGALLQAVKASGYDKTISFETKGGDIAAALRRLKQQLAV